jgi:ABC-type sugar transport system permease subunit
MNLHLPIRRCCRRFKTTCCGWSFSLLGPFLLGLLIAVLVDRVRYEPYVKSIIFLPMAISYVAAGVIWRLMYEYRPPNRPQTGTVNAILDAVIPGF